MSISRRWVCHKAEAHSGGTRILSKAIRKYGPDAFRVEHIASAKTRQGLGELEILLIQQYETKAPLGYNMTDGGHGTQGRPQTAEAKRRISLAGKGRQVSEDTRARIRAAHLGKVLTTEHREKLAKSKIGKNLPPRSAEHCARISAGLVRAHARRAGSRGA